MRRADTPNVAGDRSPDWSPCRRPVLPLVRPLRPPLEIESELTTVVLLAQPECPRNRAGIVHRSRARIAKHTPLPRLPPVIVAKLITVPLGPGNHDPATPRWHGDQTGGRPALTVGDRPALVRTAIAARRGDRSRLNNVQAYPRRAQDPIPARHGHQSARRHRERVLRPSGCSTTTVLKYVPDTVLPLGCFIVTSDPPLPSEETVKPYLVNRPLARGSRPSAVRSRPSGCRRRCYRQEHRAGRRHAGQIDRVGTDEPRQRAVQHRPGFDHQQLGAAAERYRRPGPGDRPAIDQRLAARQRHAANRWSPDDRPGVDDRLAAVNGDVTR